MHRTSIDTLLTTSNLSVGYKKGKLANRVLENLNLKLIPGQLVCLLGPNGIGKSTLLRTLSGIQNPLSGEVLLGKRPLKSLNNTELSRFISLVLTEKIPSGNLDVFHLVALGRFPYTDWTGNLKSEDQAKVTWAIETTHIGHLLHKKVHELSDGELQKTMIARALAQDGKVIILDEPTAHLDVSNRIEIMSLLKKLALTTEKAIVVSTHDLDLALQSADILWLCAGKENFFIGAPEDLILKGDLARTFEKDDFFFDINSGNFKIKKEYQGKVNLVGEGPLFYWTAHALSRVGFSLDEKASITISFQDSPQVNFTLSSENLNRTFDSIEMLTDFLKYHLN